MLDEYMKQPGVAETERRMRERAQAESRSFRLPPFVPVGEWRLKLWRALGPSLEKHRFDANIIVDDMRRGIPIDSDTYVLLETGKADLGEYEQWFWKCWEYLDKCAQEAQAGLYKINYAILMDAHAKEIEALKQEHVCKLAAVEGKYGAARRERTEAIEVGAKRERERNDAYKARDLWKYQYDVAQVRIENLATELQKKKESYSAAL